jgi:hypothetical protein
VVGRELHTICPLGEDHHEGDDRGRRTTGCGRCNNDSGSMMLASKSWMQMMTIHKGLGWIKKDLLLMNFALLA